MTCPVRAIPEASAMQRNSAQVATQGRTGALTGQQPGAVVIREQDPALMSASERLAEIGSLLARGYRRSRLSRSNCLAGRTPGERPCEPPVDTGGDNPATNKEVA